MDIHGIAPLLQVFDMPTAIHFYRDVLGFALTATSEPGDDCNWAALKLNGADLMLNTAYEADERPPAPDPARVAAHGDTCLYFGCEDLNAAYRHLRAQGVNASEPKIAPYGMKQLYFTDPDGYGLCLQWPATQQTYDSWVAAYGLEPKTIAWRQTPRLSVHVARAPPPEYRNTAVGSARARASRTTLTPDPRTEAGVPSPLATPLQ